MEGGGEVCAILLWDIVVSVLKFQVKLSMKFQLNFVKFIAKFHEISPEVSRAFSVF